MVMLGAALALGTVPGDVLGHEGDHGWLTFHDSEEGQPQSVSPLTDEPAELACEFWVEGHEMTQAEGTLEAARASDPTLAPRTLAEWNGTADGAGGYSFETGPLTLDTADVYRVWAEIDGDHRTPSREILYRPCSDGSGGDGGIEIR